MHHSVTDNVTVWEDKRGPFVCVLTELQYNCTYCANIAAVELHLLC
jgi:hypothetical protein